VLPEAYTALRLKYEERFAHCEYESGVLVQLQRESTIKAAATTSVAFEMSLRVRFIVLSFFKFVAKL
jgi:hypothetical protein